MGGENTNHRKKLNNKQEAEDIIQEIFITLWNNRLDLFIQTSLPTYLFTAARNRAFDLFSHKKVESKYIASLQNFIEDSGVQADFMLRENDLKRLIEKETQSLPPKMREVFLLSRNKNLKHKEIAKVLDISEQTVSTQIKKALRVLRMRLEFCSWLFLLF